MPKGVHEPLPELFDDGQEIVDKVALKEFTSEELEQLEKETKTLVVSTEDKKIDIANMREYLINRVPESLRANSRVLNSLDKLLVNNENTDLDEESSIYMFSNLFFSAIHSFDETVLGSEDYAYSCKYVGYRMLGLPMETAYEFTFPSKCNRIRLNVKGDMTRYTANVLRTAKLFEKNGIVAKVMDIALVPVYVTNAPLAQQAIDKIAHLMTHSKSERIQLDSATVLLDKIIKAEAGVPEQTVTNTTNNILIDFREMNSRLARTTVEKMEEGNTIRDIEAIVSKKGK